MDGCIFCKIAAHEISVEALYETDLCLAFADTRPQAPQHFLMIPKAHFGTVEQAPAEMLGALLRGAALLGAEKLPGGHRIVVNTGKDGGQTVSHLHLHVLGGRHMGWPPG